MSTLLAKCQPNVPLPAPQLATERGNEMFKMTLDNNSTDEPDHHPHHQQNGRLNSVTCDRSMDGPRFQTSIPLTATTNTLLGNSAKHDFSSHATKAQHDDEVVRNGFENPSFKYLNGNHQNHQPEQEIVLIQDEQLTGEAQKYLQDNSEIVTLRCKDSVQPEKNYASIGIGGMGNDTIIQNNNNLETQSKLSNSQQRLSSFKNESPTKAGQQQQSGISTLKRAHSQNYSGAGDKSLTVPITQVQQTQVYQPAVDSEYETYHGYTANGHNNDLKEANHLTGENSDGKLRNKPVVSPRPASLSGLFIFVFFIISFAALSWSLIY